MKHVALVGYRDWARKLAESVSPFGERYGPPFFDNLGLNVPGYDRESIRAQDMIVLVGWSDIVPLEYYKNRLVLVLHPSPLPKYRGGSPIQNQIIAGEMMSAVTLFKLDADYPEVDSGPIYGALPYSLEGNLSDVLNRIATIGARLVTRAIEDLEMGALTFTPQNESQATKFRRRKPEESEIKDELFATTGLPFHNKVRALQDPYPNAFIAYPEGRLYITQTRWEPGE